MCLVSLEATWRSQVHCAGFARYPILNIFKDNYYSKILFFGELGLGHNFVLNGTSHSSE